MPRKTIRDQFVLMHEKRLEIEESLANIEMYESHLRASCMHGEQYVYDNDGTKEVLCGVCDKLLRIEDFVEEYED